VAEAKTGKENGQMQDTKAIDAKLEYESPELTEYGSLEELTLNNPFAAGVDGDFSSNLNGT
jgi:hypothetical protein